MQSPTLPCGSPASRKHRMSPPRDLPLPVVCQDKPQNIGVEGVCQQITLAHGHLPHGMLDW